jgi:hypothetical protein
MTKRHVSIGAALILFVGLGGVHFLLQALMTVQGAFNPCTTGGHWFAGQETSVSIDSFEGISAHLTYRGNNLCTSYLGNDNFATTWSMVFSADRKGWSQTGQLYYFHIGNNSGCAHHFSQQEENTDSYLPVTMLGTCVSAGEVHQVWKQYIPVNGHVRANIDQTVMSETNYVVWTEWTRPLQVTVDGETGYRETDVPGTAGQVSDFTSMQVQRYSDDNWESTCYGNAVFYSDTSLTRYSDSQAACDHIQVWTNNPNGY